MGSGKSKRIGASIAIRLERAKAPWVPCDANGKASLSYHLGLRQLPYNNSINALRKIEP
jgi:hypothetical protein